MRTITQSFGAFCIIILSLISFAFTARAVFADDSASTTPPSATDPDDPSAVWYCDSEFDADGNPVQSCGWGHWQQLCDSDDGEQNCSQNFQMDGPTGSELFAPVVQDLLSRASLSLSANVANGLVLWSYAPIATATPSLMAMPANHSAPALSDVLSSAVLTLDLYQGVIGSSTLMYSQPLASTTSGSFPFTFDSDSSYFLALSATYPGGKYPPGETPADRCPASSQGDFCIIPSYPLSDFQNAVENGYAIEESSADLGSYVPAAYGFLTLAIPNDPPADPPVSNVLFIPGTLTSRLYMKNPDGSERELWEPRSDLDVGPLAMKPDGTSENVVYTRDLVDQLYSNDSLYSPLVQKALGSGASVYGPFESFMNGLVASGTVKEWRAFPYDWRYDVSDIVKNGTLIGTATGTPSRVYLQSIIQQLASSSPTGKVTIIAHSNGGLIAKALAIDLQSKGELNLIDHIITVGTPQFGTPKSLLDLLHGSEFTELGGLLMYSGSVRAAENTMAGPYDLLPSSAYFVNIPDAVATFDNQSPASLYQKVFGAEINSFTKLAEFVEDTFHIDSSAGLSGSVRTPIAGSKTLVDKASATHTSIDSWTPPAGLAFTAIAGWGQLTPYQIAYSGTSGLNCDRTNFFVPVACSLQPQLQNSVMETENGDDTVIAASATGIASDTLYVNLKEYEKQTGTKVVHQNLLNSQPVQKEILDELESNPQPEPYVSAKIPSDASDAKTIVSAHSPVNISATDANGNVTGIVTIPGLSGMQFEKQDIPGSSIQVVGDEKYLYLPESGSYTVSMQGYDSGATTLNVGTMGANGGVVENETYPDIPTTASTTATFNVSAGAQGPATINVDVSGSGSTTAVSAATTTQTDQNYRASLFTLRALFSWRGLPLLIRALLVKAFGDFGAQKSPNAAAYSAFQTLIGAQSGVKLTFPQGALMLRLLKELGF